MVRVGIGLTLYNNARYLPEALDSLLNQTYTGFRIALVDDQSSDETEAVCRQYVERDARVRYFRNERRLGMTAAWRRAFEVVRREYPSALYFAWASDHDRWEPTWLEKLVEALETHPDVLLAYPRVVRMSEAGQPNKRPEPTDFDTTGLVDPQARWSFMCRNLIGAGNMVYGVARADAIQRAGVYRDVILPDRLLMAELTLQGQILQVPEILWFRRETGVSSIPRQRRTLFGLRRPPLHAYVPWPLAHASSLVVRYGLKRERPSLGRIAALSMGAQYLRTQSMVQFRKASLHRRRRRLAAKAQRVTSVPAWRRAGRDGSSPAANGANAMSGTRRGWLDRRLESAIVGPLAAQMKHELSDKLKHDLSQEIASEQSEARRLRKALKGLHDEFSTANAATAAALDLLSARQEELLVKYAELASVVAEIAAQVKSAQPRPIDGNPNEPTTP